MKKVVVATPHVGEVWEAFVIVQNNDTGKSPTIQIDFDIIVGRCLVLEVNKKAVDGVDSATKARMLTSRGELWVNVEYLSKRIS